MKLQESYAVVLRADHDQFRITLLSEHMGKVRALFFGTLSAGMVVRVQINTKTQMPMVSLLEIIAAPLMIARSDIWWLHTIFALIEASVPLGSGLGAVYEQLLWLCKTDTVLDKQLQIRYCAKIITTLGLQRAIDQLCTLCMHSLHVTSVDNLCAVSLDSECASRLATWVAGSIEEHVGSAFVPYVCTKDC